MADVLRGKINSLGFNTSSSTTQIIPCIVGDEQKALDLSAFLSQKRIITPAIRPPAVPHGTSRIRISCHLGLTIDMIDTVTASLREWKQQNA
jgi:8-amino-7-oxononanoate synthase